MADKEKESRLHDSEDKKAQEETADNKEQQDAVKTQTADEKAETEEEETDPLKAAQEQIAQLKDQYLRSVAEFDNYRKRTLKEKAELILNGSEKTITAILPILDDFERALATESADPKAMKNGMDLILKKFRKTLSGLGVEQIDTKDKDFDTNFMEAVAMVPGMGDKKKGKVIDCVQTGYTLNEKVIRHAKVAVGK